MTTYPAPICSYCRRFKRDAPKLVCTAFPGGIPDIILQSGADHRLPFPGDHGLQFERRRGVPEALIVERYGAPGAIGSLEQ